MTLGISGAWIGNLTKLGPYQPVFIATASVALFWAWRYIWPATGMCTPETACAMPIIKRIYRVYFGLAFFMVLLALAFPYLAPMFY